MSAFRTHTDATTADSAAVILGLGITPAGVGAASALAAGVLPRLTTVVVNGVGPLSSWPGGDVEVPGIEVGDVIVSATKVVQAIGTAGATFDPSFSLVDVSGDVSVTALGIVTFVDAFFDVHDALILVYADVTRPTATEL